MVDEGWEYNDEFLKEGGVDHERALEDFEPLMFALYNKEIFSKYFDLDEETRKSKQRLQNYGFTSITFGLIALILAAADMALLAPTVEMAEHCPSCKPSRWIEYLTPEQAHDTIKIVAGLAALSGVLSFVTGFWQGGFGKRKRRWLQKRATCEMFRQWRWNYFLATNDDVIGAAGNQEREECYVARWKQEANAFFRDCGSELPITLDGLLEFDNDVRALSELTTVVPVQSKTPPTASQRENWLPMITDAYDAIRIRSQVRYSHYLTRQSGPFRTHPARQTSLLHRLDETSIVIIVLLHVLVIVGVLFDVSSLKQTIVHLLAVVGALIALATMCVERGLRPSAHLGRLRGYYSEVVGIRDRYRAADKHDDRLFIARDLERAALLEFSDFAQEANKARFVI